MADQPQQYPQQGNPPTVQYPQAAQQYPQQQPQQYSQYPQQQTYPQSQQYPQPQQYQPPQPPQDSSMFHHKMLTIAAILVILVASFGTYWVITSEGPVSELENTFPPVETKQTSELMIDKMVFANKIDDNMAYDENTDKIYFQTNKIFVYVEPTGYSVSEGDGGYNMNLIEDFEVRNPSGKVIPALTQEGVSSAEFSPTERVAFKNEFSLGNDFEEGNYTLKVTIRDAISGKKTEKTDTFKMNLLHFDNLRSD